MRLALDPAVGHTPAATVYTPQEPVRFARAGADGITQNYRLDRVVTHDTRALTVHLVKVNRTGRDFARGGHRVLTADDLAATHPELVHEIGTALVQARRKALDDAPAETAVLTTDAILTNAARRLGEMAGWTTPPDPGDPFVVRLAYAAARDRLVTAAATLGLTP